MLNVKEKFVFDPSTAVGEFAVNIPGATALFRNHKIDFCCGGHISLREAAEKKNVNIDTLLLDLAKLERVDEPEHDKSPSELIDYIVTRYHEVHREQLPELIRMAARVEAVHKDNPNVPKGLARFLENVDADLICHMKKEENILFPIMKQGGNPFVIQPISMMRLEHLDHGKNLDELSKLTNDCVPPVQACNTWRALYAGLDQLRNDLMNHIHLENNILFPIFEKEHGDVGESHAAASRCGCAH